MMDATLQIMVAVLITCALNRRLQGCNLFKIFLIVDQLHLLVVITFSWPYRSDFINLRRALTINGVSLNGTFWGIFFQTLK